jgi:hypothetical protein
LVRLLVLSHMLLRLRRVRMLLRLWLEMLWCTLLPLMYMLLSMLRRSLRRDLNLMLQLPVCIKLIHIMMLRLTAQLLVAALEVRGMARRTGGCLSQLIQIATLIMVQSAIWGRIRRRSYRYDTNTHSCASMYPIITH